MCIDVYIPMKRATTSTTDMLMGGILVGESILASKGKLCGFIVSIL